MNKPVEKPVVSVVIPVYCATSRHREFLRETLESVAAQTYRDFEVVLVDDCSPLDPLPIVESAGELPVVRFLRNASNLGHAESRNAGIRASEADLIAFLDHDDLWLPKKLERQVATLEANADATMTFCDVEILGHYKKGRYVDQKTIPARPSLVWFVSRPNSVITASSVLVRKQALIDIGLFDSRYSSCDDFDAWIKLLARGPIVHLPETLVKYRLHESNVNYAVNSLRDNKLLTALLLSIWRAAPLGQKLALLPALARKIAGRIVFTLRARLS